MATYEEIYGKRVKEFDSDPTLDSSYEGQVWYDKSSGTLRSVVAISAWASSSPLPIATSQSGGAGVNTASLVFGGTSPANNAEDATYEYNGSGYTNSGDLNTSRTGISGAGTQTAALGAGGYLFPGGSNHTETYNGTSWTAATAMPSANSYCSCGTQTAAIYVVSGTTLEYSSPSWTAGGGLNTPRSEASMAGTQTANIFFGGGPQTSASSASEEYDGTSFTNSATMNTARGIQIGGSGVQTSALAYGGAGPTEPGISTATESWNGTSWSTEGSLGTKASQVQKGGPTSADSTSGIAAGGFTPSRSSKTEEYAVSINTITAAAWASATNMPEANYGAGSFGTQTAFVYFGGAPYPPKTNATREYNGSSWSTTGNYIGSYMYLAGCGVETAGLGAGGHPPTQTSSAEYDGSSWTSGNSMSQQRQNTGNTMCGTQPAALVVGGDRIPTTPRSLDACEEYDGTNWSTGGTYPTVIQNTAAAGTQTAGWAAGGIIDSSPGTANTFSSSTNEYNGSSWTAGGALPGQLYRAGAAGPDTAGLIFSGATPSSPESTATFGYDGSSWSTRPNMATARQSVGAGGVSSPSTAAIGAGGYITPGTTASTEEFTGETSAITASTLTSS